MGKIRWVSILFMGGGKEVHNLIYDYSLLLWFSSLLITERSESSKVNTDNMGRRDRR